MAEGLSATEVGKEIGEHKKHADHTDAEDRRDRLLSVTEALLLSLVAVLAAYSGYAAAKWSTESSVSLAKASAARTKANRAQLEGLADPHARLGVLQRLVRGVHDGQCQRRASRREAPAGGLSPGVLRLAGHRSGAQSARLRRARPTCRSTSFPRKPRRRSTTRRRTHSFARGSEAGATGDEYVRDTVFLATVLFLVGISGHFPLRQARYGLIGVGALILVFAVIQVLGLPGPPVTSLRSV